LILLKHDVTLLVPELVDAELSNFVVSKVRQHMVIKELDYCGLESLAYFAY
jgi:hypothetical protein